MYIIDVLIEHPVRHLDSTFSYLSQIPIIPNVRVYVPFGKQKLVGYVKDCTETFYSQQQLEAMNQIKYKWISGVIDERPILNEELNQLCNYLSKTTFTPWIGCLKTMLPPSLKPSSSAKKTVKKLKYVVYKQMIDNLTTKQNEFLAQLAKQKEIPLKDVLVNRQMLMSLEKKGALQIIEKEIYRDVSTILTVSNSSVQLTSVQQFVLDKLIKGKADKPYLLFGITGSGKTEIYLQATQQYIHKNKQVLMLVPEISLTPKMVALFKARFGDDVAILHSRLSEGQRYDEYRRIQNQEVKIVVGARSAIFAPLENIGLIILDEEHDSSYKQNNHPCYHTKDIAMWRAKFHQCKLLLGSASPSIESYARAKSNKYYLLEMKERATKAKLANCTIVDMANEAKNGNLSYFSQPFIDGLKECLSQHKQALLLVNRRGYATYLLCKECGYTPKCPHCDVTLTFHKETQSLECHYCGYQEKFNYQCPSCHSSMVGLKGVGTERMEEALINEFGHMDIIRYDYDTTKNKAGHEVLLQAFENHEAEILLGTQMIAKGLDFKDVNFVGVLDGDGALSIPDFRSAERTFQLILQVAGRAGRHNTDGKVVIQTYNPKHYAIVYGAKQDYESFYNEEIKMRQLGNYPPYCYMLSILISGKNETKVSKTAQQIATFLQHQVPKVQILGPAPALITKINNAYRYRILIKYKKSQLLFEKIHELLKYVDQSIKIEVDVNPYSQL